MSLSWWTEKSFLNLKRSLADNKEPKAKEKYGLLEHFL